MAALVLSLVEEEKARQEKLEVPQMHGKLAFSIVIDTHTLSKIEIKANVVAIRASSGKRCIAGLQAPVTMLYLRLFQKAW